MSNRENIEKIFKNQFESFEQTPSSSVWTKIEKKMILKHFLKYKPLSFNLWNILATVVISTTVIMLSGNINNENFKNSEKNNIYKKSSVKSDKTIISKSNNKNEKISENKPNNEKTKKNKIIVTDNKSENQDITEKDIEVISKNPYKENYTNSESTDEGKITVKLAEPHSDFSLNKSSSCEPAVFTFLNTSENCDSYHWDFGNGETSSQKNPTFVFRTAGKYNVTLTVTSGRLSDSKSKTITIYAKPDADFEIRNKSKSLFNDEEIQFINNSSNYSKCIWNFGDMNTSNNQNPSHIYENPGGYKISLICISDKRCADTAYLNNVYIKDTKYRISFPTAFSPDKTDQNSGYWKNSAYPNSIFHPVLNNEISNYHLRIYNKYGVMVFESTNPEIGWNGFYKNSPSQTGVYIWECSAKFKNGELFKETGNVTLLYLRNQ